MGLVRDPDLYKCGLSWAAMTDIDQRFAPQGILGLDLAKRYYKYDTTDVLGDRASEAAQLKAISPIERAAELRKPLLLAFGGADESDARDARRFHAEASKGNPDVELVDYPRERHVLAAPENRIDYWNRVEKFLKRHIGQYALDAIVATNLTMRSF
jgi:dipeptidyl aminopeptidase/acylaminoacyl peptidase